MLSAKYRDCLAKCELLESIISEALGIMSRVWKRGGAALRRHEFKPRCLVRGHFQDPCSDSEQRVLNRPLQPGTSRAPSHQAAAGAVPRSGRTRHHPGARGKQRASDAHGAGGRGQDLAGNCRMIRSAQLPPAQPGLSPPAHGHPQALPRFPGHCLYSLPWPVPQPSDHRQLHPSRWLVARTQTRLESIARCPNLAPGDARSHFCTRAL